MRTGDGKISSQNIDGDIHVEDTGNAEGTRVPAFLILLERRVKRVGELADDRDGPLGTREMRLLLLVVVLLGEEERCNDSEDSKDNGGAIRLLEGRDAGEVEDREHLAQRRVGLDQGRGRRRPGQVEALLASVEDGCHFERNDVTLDSGDERGSLR